MPPSRPADALQRTRQRLAALADDALARRTRNLLQRDPRLSRAEVAREFGISARHLARRLAAEGVSFRQLRDLVRAERAMRCLRAGTASAAIAEMLGFCDESAFGRAFRRWTGTPPGHYRDG